MCFEIEVNKVIESFDMLRHVDCVYVAISGGVDSVSLLHFFVNNYRDKCIVRAIHVNHKLRRNESDRDENFVIEYCRKMNVNLLIKKTNVFEISKKNKIGIEECARNIRYDYFNEILKKNDRNKIALAHSLSDSIETVIFNLARGTGLQGICGIPPKRGNFIRPFIHLTKDEIINYASNNNLKYVEDSSNFSLKYSRNKVRICIIPVLREINSNFEKNMLNFLKQSREDNFFLSEICENKIKKNDNFNINLIKKLPNSIKTRVIKKILEKISKKYTEINYKHINLLEDLINKKIKNFTLPGNNLIRLDNYDNIISSDLDDIDDTDKTLTQNNNKFRIIDWVEYSLINKAVNIIDLFVLKNKKMNYKIRNRLPGDYFKFPERNCTKSLKKLFNEIKMSVKTRSEVILIAYGSEIVWIENFGLSRCYRVKFDTNVEDIGIIVGLDV